MKKNSLYIFVLLIFWLFSRSNSYAQNNFWNDDFKLVQIPSSIDTVVQPAYFLDSKEKSNPLLVSLHTWSGDYTQADSLAYLAKNEKWINYWRRSKYETSYFLNVLWINQQFILY